MNQTKNNNFAGSKQNFSQSGMLMYEQVLSKNFEIIQNFLKRFHDVYSKQQEFEHTIVSFRERIQFFETKLQAFTQNSKEINKNFQKKIVQIKNSIKNRQLYSSQEERRSLQQSYQIRNSSLLISQQAKKQFQKQMIVKIMEINSELRDRLNKNQQDIQEANQQITNMNDNFRCYLNVLESNIEGTKEIYADRKQFTDLKAKIEQQINKQSNLLTQKIDSTFLQKIEDINCEINQNIISIHNRIVQIEQTAELDRQRSSKQYKQIRADLLKIVQESTQVFANKQDTKKQLLILDKKISRTKAQKIITTRQAKHGQSDPSLTFKQGKCLSCHDNFLKKDPPKFKPSNSNLFLSKFLKAEVQNKQNQIQRNEITSALGHRRLVKSRKSSKHS